MSLSLIKFNSYFNKILEILSLKFDYHVVRIKDTILKIKMFVMKEMINPRIVLKRMYDSQNIIKKFC
jgi:hypothetical protein